jgi:hypothetical protein
MILLSSKLLWRNNFTDAAIDVILYLLLLLLIFIAFMKHQHVDITLLFMKCTFAILSNGK